MCCRLLRLCSSTYSLAIGPQIKATEEGSEKLNHWELESVVLLLSLELVVRRYIGTSTSGFQQSIDFLSNILIFVSFYDYCLEHPAA